MYSYCFDDRSVNNAIILVDYNQDTLFISKQIMHFIQLDPKLKGYDVNKSILSCYDS